jgi:hypothetical protein
LNLISDVRILLGEKKPIMDKGTHTPLSMCSRKIEGVGGDPPPNRSIHAQRLSKMAETSRRRSPNRIKKNALSFFTQTHTCVGVAVFGAKARFNGRKSEVDAGRALPAV